MTALINIKETLYIQSSFCFLLKFAKASSPTSFVREKKKSTWGQDCPTTFAVLADQCKPAQLQFKPAIANMQLVGVKFWVWLSISAAVAMALQDWGQTDW